MKKARPIWLSLFLFASAVRDCKRGGDRVVGLEASGLGSGVCGDARPGWRDGFCGGLCFGLS